MDTRQLTLPLGGLLGVAGLVLPSTTLLQFLRTPQADVTEPLLLGATLFKISLVLLGVWVLVLGRTPIWKAGIPRAKDEFGPQSTIVLGLLLVILVAAALLRLHGLGSGLWYDEIVAYVKYARLPFGEIVSTYDSENQHPLYSLLAHAAFVIFGESGWSLRLPAALFGVGSIWALYLLGREVAGAREALIAGALLTVSYHHIWFSQNARGYSGLLFWTILASWLFLRALREGRLGLWVLFGAAAAFGVYTHMTMLFVIAGHLVTYGVALVTRPEKAAPNRWAGLYVGFPLAGLLTLQLHALTLPQMFGAIRRTESLVPAWKRPLWTIFEFAQGLEIGFSGSVVALAAILICGAGLWDYARTRPELLQLLVIPPLLGAALVVAMGHHLWPRFFFFTLGFGALVVVRGTTVLGGIVSQTLRLASARSVALGTALSVALIVVAATSAPGAYAPKQDYRSALEFVESGREPGDAVVIVGLATFPYKSFYKMEWEVVDSVQALDAIRGRAHRTWLVYTLPTHLRAVFPDIMASVERDFSVVKRFYGTLGGGTIFVCRSRGTDPRSDGRRVSAGMNR